MTWREKIDPKLRQQIEAQIAGTAIAKNAYLHADDPAAAQLWVAVANLAQQCFELKVEIANIDNALRDSLMQRQAAKSVKTIAKTRSKRKKAVKKARPKAKKKQFVLLKEA